MLNDINFKDEVEWSFEYEYECNFADEDEWSLSIHVWLAVFTIFTTLFACVNFLTVFLIFTFNKLRKSPINVILAHLNILQGVACLASIVVIGLAFFEWSELTHLHQRVLYYSEKFTAVSLLGTVLFQFQLLLEWYLKNYSNAGRHQKFCRIYMFLIFFIHFISLAGMLMFQFYYKRVFLSIILKCYYEKNNVALAVVTISTVCWSPDIISCLIFAFSENFNLHISLIAQLVGSFSSVLVLLYLSFCDEYRGFFTYVFACRPKNSYEILEEEVQVAFQEMSFLNGQIWQNGMTSSTAQLTEMDDVHLHLQEVLHCGGLYNLNHPILA